MTDQSMITGGAVAAEPKMQFRATLLHKGLNLMNGTVPDTQIHLNGAQKAFPADVPLGSTSTEL